MKITNKKIKFIVPARDNRYSELERWDNRFFNLMNGVVRYSNMVASLPILAALTPRAFDISIEDENIESLSFDAKVDIVAITAYTSTAPRMYEIADIYRKRGVTVILGGVHVSIFPEEALQHADAVVVGEAENIWPQIMRDYLKKGVKKIYKAHSVVDLDKQPLPRYDLVKNDQYAYYAIQTTRGCPYSCKFCYVHSLHGNQYRQKTVNNILREVKYLLKFGKKRFYFCDDHFTINRKRTLKLLRRLIPLNISYGIQARLEIYKDEQLLDLLHASGCVNIIIGFESVNQATIDFLGKGYRVDEYYGAIEKIQSKGLFITGSFIIGFDNDDKNVFNDLEEFVKRSGIGNCIFNILTPLPDTSYFDHLKKDGRILHQDWTYYDCRHVCFAPKHMSPEELLAGFRKLNKNVFSLDAVYERTMRVYALWNKEEKRRFERLHPLLLGFSAHDVAYAYEAEANI